jgi:hypothetical protein
MKMTDAEWTAADISDQTGRVAVVTGANSIRAAAAQLGRSLDRLDLLINNAAPPVRPPPLWPPTLEARPPNSAATSPVPLQPLMRLFMPLTQSAAMGALPTLRAATDPAAIGGQYYGPDGFMESRGHPVLVESSQRSHDRDLQRQVWDLSESLTGVEYPI